ncbi:MAG: DUF448 domain-containing protein [Deltaproteobacteria bacterium]|nr:DUF448 domain-containing protein [Deltaproteobacteria bacterium]
MARARGHGTRRSPREKKRAASLPMRTCVVSREERPASELLRIVAGPGDEAIVDGRGKLPGRGAWVTPTRASFEAIVAKPGALRHALEAPALRVGSLLAQARVLSERAVLDMLSLSARCGGLVSGADALERLGPGKALALLVATDASPKAVEAARVGIEAEIFVVDLDKEALGHRIGKGPRAVVALMPCAPARRLLAELRRALALR